jgi:hypothetical protein
MESISCCRPQRCSWPKPRTVAKLRGLPVSAAAFDASHPSTASTGCAVCFNRMHASAAKQVHRKCGMPVATSLVSKPVAAILPLVVFQHNAHAEGGCDERCREVLIGTESGALHCLVMGEADKKERLWAPLLELDTPTPAVRGCYQQACQCSHLPEGCQCHTKGSP